LGSDGELVCMPSRSVLLRSLFAGAVLVSGIGGLRLAGASTTATVSACNNPVLVLSAMPIEISPLLSAATITKTVTVADRSFYVGTLRGHNVVLAMTRIGPVNATATTQLALKTFRCGSRPAFGAAVFSGVAGGDYIGDVAVPDRWTLDNGKSWLPVDPTMLTAARTLEHKNIGLERKTPVGDPLCTCVIDPDTVATNAVLHKPVVEVGGNGQTTDPVGGHAVPCVPGDNDIAGCAPCPVAKHVKRDVTDFPTGVVPFVEPNWIAGYFSGTGGSSQYKYVAEDEETAAVDKVVTAAQIPFIGFRAASDATTPTARHTKGGDPLYLPGFPVTFAYYRQLASDNAAIATMAFLQAWKS
jgi:nucleoside phosphorylase